MSSYASKLIQTAVLWRRTGTHKTGAPEVGTPSEIPVRWLGNFASKYSAFQNSNSGDGTVLVNQEIPLRSLIMLGTLSQLENDTHPEIFEISGFQSIVGRRKTVRMVNIGQLKSQPRILVGGEYVVTCLTLKWHSGQFPVESVGEIDLGLDVAAGDVIQVYIDHDGNQRTIPFISGIDFPLVPPSSINISDLPVRVGDTLVITNFGQQG